MRGEKKIEKKSETAIAMKKEIFIVYDDYDASRCYDVLHRQILFERIFFPFFFLNEEDHINGIDFFSLCEASNLCVCACVSTVSFVFVLFHFRSLSKTIRSLVCYLYPIHIKPDISCLNVHPCVCVCVCTIKKKI